MRRNETAHNEKQNGTGEYEANGQELKYIAEAMRWVRVLVWVRLLFLSFQWIHAAIQIYALLISVFKSLFRYNLRDFVNIVVFTLRPLSLPMLM